jgi:hypothetical protein
MEEKFFSRLSYYMPSPAKTINAAKISTQETRAAFI